MLDLQKASISKRISAFILDFIVILILITGFAWIFSASFGFDEYSHRFDERKIFFEKEYCVNFNISPDNYNNLDESEKAKYSTDYENNYKKAEEAFLNDKEAAKTWDTLISLIFTITSLSVFFAYILAEITIPLFFGNGQTVGKKVFSLGVMKSNQVKISAKHLFVRGILGKYTIETMVPILLFLMSFLGLLGFVGTLVIFLILCLQIALMIITKTNSTIHDILSYTVVVDMQSQMIFESEESLLEYQESENLTL